MSGRKLRRIEHRVLGYLDQRGATHRTKMVQDLADSQSRIGLGIMNGSNSAVPLIAGSWCVDLICDDLVRAVFHNGFYQHHEITQKGREFVRSGAGARS